MGHLHPPNPDCHTLDKIEFWLLFHKNLKFKGVFVKNFKLHPQTKFLDTPLLVTVA
jgi:hypothetical protein